MLFNVVELSEGRGDGKGAIIGAALREAANVVGLEVGVVGADLGGVELSVLDGEHEPGEFEESADRFLYHEDP